MEFGLNEILTIIDKVKSTDLSMFEYQDADTKIKIKGTKKANGIRRNPPAGSAVADSMDAQFESATVIPFGSVHAETRDAEEESVSAQEHIPTGEITLQASEEKEGQILASPMVGTFYSAPSEKETPFVQVGDRVKKGQTGGIVEAMKLMNEIESEWDGIVTEILVSNEQMVEYGQPLLRIQEEI